MSTTILNPACAEQFTTTTTTLPDTSGSTIWVEQTGTTEDWKGITWSGISDVLAACVSGGKVWTSTNTGDTWVEQSAFPGSVDSTSISSSDPTISSTDLTSTLLVVTSNSTNSIYRSTDSGVTWTTQQPSSATFPAPTPSPTASYGCSAISKDGTHALVGRTSPGVDALTYSNDAFDAAGTWIGSDGVDPFTTSVTGLSPSTAGGGYRVYFGFSPVSSGSGPFNVSGSGLIWVGGVPFISNSFSPNLDWTAMTVSNNGKFALITATGEKIRTASNFGSGASNWKTLGNSSALNWVDIAARSDKNTDDFGTIAAIESPGSIWMSFDNGITWEAMPGTSGKNWSGITCKSDGSAFAATVDGENIWMYVYPGDVPGTTTTTINGGPQPPRLWSRAQNACIPTTDSNPPLLQVATQQELDMRRKAEILQYKKNDSNMSKQQLWARMIKGHGPYGKRTWATQSADGTYTNPNKDDLAEKTPFTLLCPGGGPNNCAPTTHSDVPGKQMMLCMRPDIPLTNYKVRRTYLAGGTKWPQTAWKPGDKGFPVGKAGRNLIFN